MASPDLLFNLRNLFYLGAYQAAINNIDIPGLDAAAAAERDTIVFRSYIALGSYQVRTHPASGASAATSLQVVKLLALYLTGDKRRYVMKKINISKQNDKFQQTAYQEAFSKPSVGVKVAKYPRCSHPELVMGLREHTDAGGIILLFQDELILGLEFLKDGRWKAVPPTQGNRIFVNLGDQIEVITNGTYKSICHRVLPNKNGSRLSIATFYNPGADAIICPASKRTYPSQYRFQDYLDFYSTTKFTDKVFRFQTTKAILK
ncbi:1-aminocyclopropane-1-carboxylate oxidase 1 [Zea mays]|uniref:1-aminocyclopropane-1-carboxylate oxidase 1 n=1 Tax=Zea mays TaxID=4577 RepID=A0A3L6DFS0_MAIZE|nr:1-aminocyclopropane-1-carboxylate oxidase 1 [Zea mays]